MEFPLNQQDLSSEYVSKILELKSTELIFDNSSFQRLSAHLVKSFKRKINKYGSIHLLPVDVLEKYNKAFSELFRQFKTLRSDLQRQVNENTKHLENLSDPDNEDSCIQKLYKHKQNRLQQKIVYYDSIYALTMMIANYC